MLRVDTTNIRAIRSALGLSRSELSRFLGVSEATIARWESDEAVTEPRGLQAVLLRAIADAAAVHPAIQVARVVRSCGHNHRTALQELFAAAG
jgi:transcriptional regulator with XRE-family HTH domain